MIVDAEEGSACAPGTSPSAPPAAKAKKEEAGEFEEVGDLFFGDWRLLVVLCTITRDNVINAQ